MTTEPSMQSLVGLQYANKFRRPAVPVCRFFVNNGVCHFGPGCQYVHEMPHSVFSEQTADQRTADSADGLVGLGRNGDQYFSATFQPPGVNSMPDVSDYSMPPPPAAVVSDMSHVTMFTSSPQLESSTITCLSVADTTGRSPAKPLMTHSHSLVSSPYHNSTSSLAIQEDVGGTTYFFTHDDINSAAVAPAAAQPRPLNAVMPQCSVYPGPMPHVAHMKLLKSKASLQPSYFMPEELKMEILNRQVLTSLQLDSTSSSGLPAEVDNYHKLFPLELPPSNPLHKSSTFGYQTSVYKAVNTKDGLTYCLRRIHEFRLVSTKCMSDIELWKKILHPNLVNLREVFTTKAFGDHSMVFVYDYHAAAETLMNHHFTSRLASNSNNVLFGQSKYSPGDLVNGGGGGGGLVPEPLIWTYVIQLSSVLRTIHAHGLACRVMDPTKILLVDKTRVRLNCVGVFDVVSFDPNLQSGSSQMERYQQEDLTSLGRVILSLANSSVQCLQSPAVAIAHVARLYSSDLKNLILSEFTTFFHFYSHFLPVASTLLDCLTCHIFI